MIDNNKKSAAKTMMAAGLTAALVTGVMASHSVNNLVAAGQAQTKDQEVAMHAFGSLMKGGDIKKTLHTSPFSAT